MTGPSLLRASISAALERPFWARAGRGAFPCKDRFDACLAGQDGGHMPPGLLFGPRMGRDPRSAPGLCAGGQIAAAQRTQAALAADPQRGLRARVARRGRGCETP